MTQNHENDDCNITDIVTRYNTPLPEVFHKHIGHLLHIAAHMLHDGEEVPLVFVGVDADDDAHLIDPEGVPLRPLIRIMVREAIKQSNSIAVIMMSEGWSLPETVTKEWVKGRRPEGMAIKDHPEAFEVLMMSVETLDGTWGGRVKINPTIQGQPRTVIGEMVFDKLIESNGNFDNLLPQNSADDDEDQVMLTLAQLMGMRMKGEPVDKEDENSSANEASKDDEAAKKGPSIIVVGL